MNTQKPWFSAKNALNCIRIWNHTQKYYDLKSRQALPDGFSGISMPENHTPLSCFKIDGLNFASKPTQKSRDFIQNRIKNQFKKLKRKTAVFFNFRLLDYLSSALTVGYTKFDYITNHFNTPFKKKYKPIRIFKNVYRFIIVLLNFLSDFIVSKALI